MDPGSADPSRAASVSPALSELDNAVPLYETVYSRWTATPVPQHSTSPTAANGMSMLSADGSSQLGNGQEVPALPSVTAGANGSSSSSGMPSVPVVAPNPPPGKLATENWLLQPPQLLNWVDTGMKSFSNQRNAQPYNSLAGPLPVGIGAQLPNSKRPLHATASSASSLPPQAVPRLLPQAVPHLLPPQSFQQQQLLQFQQQQQFQQFQQQQQQQQFQQFQQQQQLFLQAQQAETAKAAAAAAAAAAEAEADALPGARAKARAKAQALGLLQALESAGMSGQAVDNAAAAAVRWCEEQYAHSVHEIVQHSLLDEFVRALGLPRIPASKVQDAMQVAAGAASQDHVLAPVPVSLAACGLGTTASLSTASLNSATPADVQHHHIIYFNDEDSDKSDHGIVKRSWELLAATLGCQAEPWNGKVRLSLSLSLSLSVSLSLLSLT